MSREPGSRCNKRPICSSKLLEIGIRYQDSAAYGPEDMKDRIDTFISTHGSLHNGLVATSLHERKKGISKVGMRSGKLKGILKPASWVKLCEMTDVGTIEIRMDVPKC